MPDNYKNVVPGCIVGRYVKRNLGFIAAFPHLFGNGSILFKNIYRTAGRKNEVRRKKNETGDIAKDTFFQAKFFTKIGIEVKESRYRD
jgi:hypothetical protein